MSKAERGRLRRSLVLGSGVAGLAAAEALCDAGVPTLLVGAGRPLQSGSARDGEGLNAALGPDDSVLRHVEDSLRVSGPLARAPLVQGLCAAAPDIVERAARYGMPLLRDIGGSLLLVQGPGSTRGRTALVGLSSGRSLVSALDSRLRRFEEQDVVDERGVTLVGERLLKRAMHHVLLDLVRDDDGVVVGAIVMDLRQMAVQSVPADGVVLATGRYDYLLGQAQATQASLGAGLAVAARAGAILSGLHLRARAPLSVVVGDRELVLPSALLGLGAVVWSQKSGTGTAPELTADKERDYPLARLDAGAPASELARILERQTRDVYLDLRTLTRAADAIGLADLGRRVFADPSWYGTLTPVRPASAGTLGGLWVDHESDSQGNLVTASPRQQATSLAGLYAAGDVAVGCHGTEVLTGNRALANWFTGSLAAASVVSYREALERSAHELPNSVFDKHAAATEERLEQCLGAADDGPTPRAVLSELCALVSGGIQGETSDAFAELQERAAGACSHDRLRVYNQDALLALLLPDLVPLGQAIVHCASANDAGGTAEQLVRVASGEPESILTFEYACAGQSLTGAAQRGDPSHG